MNPKSWGKEYGEPWDWSSRPKYEPETFGSIGSCYTTIDIEIHGCKRIPELLIWYSCEDVLSRHIMSHPYKLLQSPKLFDLYTSGNPLWRSIDHTKNMVIPLEKYAEIWRMDHWNRSTRHWEDYLKSDILKSPKLTQKHGLLKRQTS
jgi:hypothetical protein